MGGSTFVITSPHHGGSELNSWRFLPICDLLPRVDHIFDSALPTREVIIETVLPKTQN